MKNDPLVRKLFKAAQQRLTESEILHKNEQFLASVYLGGYAVECALKALLIARTPQRSKKATQDQVFRGKSGHDFENLKARLRKLNVNFTLPVTKGLRTVSSWSTDLRYAVGRGSAEDSEAFFNAAAQILGWVEKQL